MVSVNGCNKQDHSLPDSKFPVVLFTINSKVLAPSAHRNLCRLGSSVLSLRGMMQSVNCVSKWFVCCEEMTVK